MTTDVAVTTGTLKGHSHLFRRIISGVLTLKFDRASRPFLKFDRRHWTILIKINRKFWKIVTGDIAIS